MDSKLIGGILLITGTSIGAGMLGLPIAGAKLGFIGSLILLILAWLMMMLSAYYILEVQQWLKKDSNIISMAGATIGPIGKAISWICYLALLYALLCAYIAGGSDLFHNLIHLYGLEFPLWATACLFTLFFGAIVFAGIHSVDKMNRLLMSLKFITLFAAIFSLLPFIQIPYLGYGDIKNISSISIIAVTIASFGWATLVPSLVRYFDEDIHKLKKAIFIGSLIPLICYIFWDAAIMGVLPYTGENSLSTLIHASNSTSSLVNILSQSLQKPIISFFIKFFTSICVLTSFLGVALCLTDFLADGLQIRNQGKNRLMIHSVTFIPALCIAIFFPNVFILALEYAGIFTVVLLILLPATMVYLGRYHRQINKGFKVFGGKPLLMLLFIVGLVITVLSLFE